VTDPRSSPSNTPRQQPAFRIGGILRAHFALVDDVFNFLNGVLGAAPEVPLREVSLARHVATGLLVRIANDLRCMTMSALSGYPLQAAAVVATMYEVACAAVCIDSDDSVEMVVRRAGGRTARIVGPAQNPSTDAGGRGRFDV
jgi:hypothetical protein